MQDINSNISHRDMKPYYLVAPSPLPETTFPVVSYDNNNVNTFLRAGNETDLNVLGQYINEPGPNRYKSYRKLTHLINEPGSKYQIIYNHIVRELLNIASGGTMDNILDRYWLARCRDNCRLEYFVIDLKKNGIDYFEWICSLEEDGIIDETKLDELLCINSYLNFVQNRTGPISDGYADITKCTRDDFVRFTKQTHTFEIEYNEKEAFKSKERGTQDIEFHAQDC